MTSFLYCGQCTAPEPSCPCVRPFHPGVTNSGTPVLVVGQTMRAIPRAIRAGALKTERVYEIEPEALALREVFRKPGSRDWKQRAYRKPRRR